MGILFDAFAKDESLPSELRNIAKLNDLVRYLNHLKGLHRGAAYKTNYQKFSAMGEDELEGILAQFDPGSELAKKSPHYYLAFYVVYQERKRVE